MLRIYLDNNLIPEAQHSDISDAEFTLSRSEHVTGAVSVGFSNTITFYDAAGAYVKGILIDAPGAQTNQIKIELREQSDCCNYLFFRGIITSNEVEWCDIVEGSRECNTINCQAIEDTPYTCLQTALVANNTFGFQDDRHPFVPHCIELRPNFVAILMYVFAIVLYIVFIAIIPLIYPLSFVFSAMNVILVFFGFPEIDFSGTEGTQSLLTAAFEFQQRLVDAVIGCGNGQFAPYVRSYLDNICKTCNLTLQSSIFSPASPYYNTMYYVAPVSKIEKYANDGERIQRQGQYFKDNAPNETADDWLNQLRLAFNAGWEIRDNVLIFERKDFFFQGSNLPINPTNIIKLCYKFKDKPQPQFSILSYQLDGIETCGGEALRRYYWRLQDYDPNNLNPNLRGKAKYPIPFAPTRFRNDGIDTDVLNIFNSIPLVELLFPDDFERALILPDNLSFVPKLLIHDINTPFDNAQVKWEESTTTAGVIDYNLDFWLDPPYSNNHTNDYYDRFFKIDEPSVTNQLNREFEMELNYDCEFLQLISLNKTIEIDTGVTGIKIAKINTITIGKTLILRGDL